MKKALLTLICIAAMLAATPCFMAQEITITLHQEWNWISYPRADTLGFAEAMGTFTPMEGDIIADQNDYAEYNEGGWYGTIEQFFPGWGYMYYSNRTEPVTFTFQLQQPVSEVTITTFDPSKITPSSVTLGSTVTMDEGNHVFARGVCWSTEPNPDVDDNSMVGDPVADSLSHTIVELTQDTTYYVRSFVVTDNGLVYGNEVSFTTPHLTEIKILSLGNSYSSDAFAYVPFILENMLENVHVQIGILNMASATIPVHVASFENEDPGYHFYLYNGGGAWQYRSQHTIQYALDNYEWDIIMLQQASGYAAYWSYYQPSLDTLLSLFNNYLDYPVKYGWYMVQARPARAINGENYPEETILSKYSRIVENSQRVINETACEFLVPIGTAVQNARTIPELKAMGDYADIELNTSGLGYMCQEGIHLQEGLPSQIAAYTMVHAILEQYGCLENHSILGENTRVTAEWLEGKKIPGKNGEPIGSNDTLCLIGQQCVIEAFNNPYEITDMNDFFNYFSKSSPNSLQRRRSQKSAQSSCCSH